MKPEPEDDSPLDDAMLRPFVFTGHQIRYPGGEPHRVRNYEILSQEEKTLRERLHAIFETWGKQHAERIVVDAPLRD